MITNGKGEGAVGMAVRKVTLPLGITAVCLIVWEVSVRAGGIPLAILPPPSAVARTIAAEWPMLVQHTWVTTWQCVVGFLYAVVGGVGLGILIASSRFFREGVYPIVIAFQVVPKVALAPLFLLWFGLGSTSRLLLAFFIAFFPMVVNTFTGLTATDEDMVQMARAFHASRWQIFAKIRLPSALPYIFSGLKISITFSVIGIIVAEFVTAQEGLGYLIVFSEGILDTPLLMAALTILSLVGLILYWLVALLHRSVVRWEGSEAQ